MPTCFVIQPFDSGKFDKRFEDTYEPALREAGLDVYRVDEDPTAEVLINSIEKGIRDAAICLADITTDNPNVWYELGYAFATRCPVIMVCSEERSGNGYPFDIQHRHIIRYKSDAKSDFDILGNRIKERATALLHQGAATKQIVENEQVAMREGLTQIEILVLAVVAGQTILPDNSIGMYDLEQGVERSGLTSVGLGLALRRLAGKEFVKFSSEEDPFGNQSDYRVIFLTEKGWNWIDNNEDIFSLIKGKNDANDINDDLPF